MQHQIPQPILDAAANMFRPYGIDLPEILNNHELQPPAKPLEKKWLNYQEVEICFGVRRWTLWRALRNGKIRASKPSGEKQRGKTLFDRDSITAWIEGNVIEVHTS